MTNATSGSASDVARPIETRTHPYATPFAPAGNAALDRVFDQRLHDQRRHGNAGQGMRDIDFSIESLLEALPSGTTFATLTVDERAGR